MIPTSIKSRLVELELEEKTKHVRDTAYWGLPEGTPIVPGMKPKGHERSVVPKKPKEINEKPKSPKQPKAKVKTHPAFPDPKPDDPGELYRWDQNKKKYEGRTKHAPRNSGDYEGMTAQEMWDDWEPERKRFAKRDPDDRTRADKKTGNAIEAYTGSDYEYMNGLGRMDEVATADLGAHEVKETRQQIKDMDRGMREVGKDIVVYRTTTAPVFQNLGVGAQFRDRGYTSTTVLEGYLDEVRTDLYNDNDYLTYMEIRVPAKQKAIYASAIQKNRNRDSDIGEGELVLARGTEYKVVEKNGNTLVLEAILPDSDDATDWEDVLDDYTKALYEEKLAEEDDEDY